MKCALVGGGTWGSEVDNFPGPHSSQRWNQAVWPELVLLARMPPASQGIRMTRRGEMAGCGLTVLSASWTGQGRLLCGIAQRKGNGNGTRTCFLLRHCYAVLWGSSFFLSASFLFPSLCPPSGLALTFLLIFLPHPSPLVLLLTLRGLEGEKEDWGWGE